MLVVDTSALLTALVVPAPMQRLADRLADDGDLHVPHLIDTEMLHALRRLRSNNRISEERATDALRDFEEMGLRRYAHKPLNKRVWDLRHNLTAYDATFVALAELLGAPLITCDARLAAAPANDAVVEFFGAN